MWLFLFWILKTHSPRGEKQWQVREEPQGLFSIYRHPKFISSQPSLSISMLVNFRSVTTFPFPALDLGIFHSMLYSKPTSTEDPNSAVSTEWEGSSGTQWVWWIPSEFCQNVILEFSNRHTQGRPWPEIWWPSCLGLEWPRAVGHIQQVRRSLASQVGRQPLAPPLWCHPLPWRGLSC